MIMTFNKLTHTEDDTFSRTALIYCVRILEDGSFQLLNRNYSIIGHGGRYDRPEGPNTTFKPVRFTKRMRAKIAYNGEYENNYIFLYGDGCKPDSSPEDWAAYSKRLEALLKLKVKRSAQY
jgi:hypothetical protein